MTTFAPGPPTPSHTTARAYVPPSTPSSLNAANGASHVPSIAALARHHEDNEYNAGINANYTAVLARSEHVPESVRATTYEQDAIRTAAASPTSSSVLSFPVAPRAHALRTPAPAQTNSVVDDLDAANSMSSGMPSRVSSPLPASHSRPSSPSKRHKWTAAEEAELARILWDMEDLQARLFGRKKHGRGRSEKGKRSAELNTLGRRLHGENAMGHEVYRHKAMAMHKRYNTTKEQLSQTGQNKTGTEIVEGSKLEEERVRAARECHYFEIWHEMALDRRSSQPPRVRLPGQAAALSGSITGKQKAIPTTDEDQDEEDDSSGPEDFYTGWSDSGAEEDRSSSQPAAKRARMSDASTQATTTAGPARPSTSSSGSSHSATAAKTKKKRAPYRGADGLAELTNSMRRTQEHSNERQEKIVQTIMANQEREQARKDEELELAKRRLEVDQQNGETQQLMAAALSKLADKL